MHILLASLIITGAMCDIVDLDKWESNDAPHDVHQSCRARPIYWRIIKEDDEGAFVPAIDNHKQKLRPET